MLLSRAVRDSFFFFSSRRRHTRCSRDWSSDVCSSDLWMAGFGFKRRLATTNSAFDRAIYSSTWLHAAAQIAACQSERVLDPPFAFAQLLIVTAFAVILGGTLLDNARLFDEVNHLASSD